MKEKNEEKKKMKKKNKEKNQEKKIERYKEKESKMTVKERNEIRRKSTEPMGISRANLSKPENNP